MLTRRHLSQSLFESYLIFSKITTLISFLIFVIFALVLLIIFNYYHFRLQLVDSTYIAQAIAEKYYSEYIFESSALDYHFSKEELLSLKREMAYEEIKNTLTALAHGLVVIRELSSGHKETLIMEKTFYFEPLKLKIRLGYPPFYITKVLFMKAIIVILLIFLFHFSFVIYQKRFLEKIKRPLEQLALELKSGGRLSPIGYEEIDQLIYAINRAIDKEREMVEKLAAQQKLVALGTFAGGYAHEFNNLLQIMSMNLELVERYLQENRCEQVYLLLNKINSSILKGQKLAQKLLYLTKKTETEYTNLKDFLEQFQESLRILIPREIRFELSLPAEDLFVPLSEESVKEILINLVKNAVDAIEERRGLEDTFSGIIKIRLGVDGDRGLLEVVDNGIGIKEEHLPRLFEPFFSTKGVGKGTGLGLYLVHNLVKNAEGDIEVESKYLEGTTFRIWLPLIKTPPESIVESPIGEEKKEILYKKILIVEDEEEIRETLAEFLRSFGLEVKTASDGVEGWKYIEKESFDIAFVDMFMPIRGGDWIITQMEKHNKNSPSLVLMTGYAGEMEEIIKKALREGRIHAILRKPFSLDQIVKILTGGGVR